ncbi:MAG TPA: hypothetical protein PLI77_05090 [Bacteroidales bacterium]|nr:hypothetical protein [Bacteroidales bacterium]HRW33575.1 hypothetical protein [Thermotogota bacterium]
MKEHLTIEQIEKYIDSEYIQKRSVFYPPIHHSKEIPVLPMEEIIRMEEHLNECDLCLSRLTKALDFSISFQEWTEEKPTRSQKMMINILKELPYQDQSIRIRILNWLKEWGVFISNTVDVVMDTSYNGISNITKIFKKSTMNPENPLVFKYPVESFAMRGNTNTPFEKKRENILNGYLQEKMILEIQAHSQTKAIHIICNKAPGWQSSPVIILIPTQSGKPIIRTAYESKNKDQFEVSIEGLNPGKYLLAFEPFSIQKQSKLS